MMSWGSHKSKPTIPFTTHHFKVKKAYIYLDLPEVEMLIEICEGVCFYRANKAMLQ